MSITRLSGAAGFVFVSVFSAGVPAAERNICEPMPVGDWPVCSMANMVTAINPGMTSELIGNLNLAAFEGGANRALTPGQANMSLFGPVGVSAGGAACAKHVMATSVADDGRGSPFTPEMAARVKELTGKDVPTSKPGSDRVVFQVFSPNLAVHHIGALGMPRSMEHGGVAGWPQNSASNVRIVLTDATPGKLKAGQTYSARADAPTSDQRSGKEPSPTSMFFSDWRGNTIPMAYGPPANPRDAEEQQRSRKLCRQYKKSMRAWIPDTSHGRAVRDRNCNIEKTAFEGRKRRLYGSMKGRVEIEAVTRDTVIGHFELTGNGMLVTETYEYQYDNNGKLTGSNRTEREETKRPLSISGSFRAPNRYSNGVPVPEHRYVKVSGDDTDESGEPLEVESHLPRVQKRNVAWDDPGIAVSFSERVDASSLTPETVELLYKDGSGSMRSVDTRGALADPSTVRVRPVDALKDGVRYRVRLVSGSSGIKSETGQPLAADYEWDFYTMVDLNEGQAGDDGVEPRIYQVSRDVKLVPNKATLTRVYANWSEREDVDPAWQVTKFPAHVRVKDADDKPLYPEKSDYVFERRDQYSDNDKRMALNSANLYNWRPKQDETPTIRAEIEPADQCGDPIDFDHEKTVEYTSEVPPLKVAYYYLRVGAWRDGVPPVDRQRARTAARRTGTFIEQNFPFNTVRFVESGEFKFNDEFAEEAATALDKAKAEGNGRLTAGATKAVMRRFHDSLTGAGGADVFVAFVPYSYIGGGGANWDYAWGLSPQEKARGLGDGGLPNQRYAECEPTKSPEQSELVYHWPTVRMAINENTPRLSVLAHEVGHIFGLQHIPWPANACERKRMCNDGKSFYSGINGFRIAESGDDGWNKSSREGNEQSADNLYPLMYPCGVAYDDTFISDSQYRRLLRHTGKLSTRGLLGRITEPPPAHRGPDGRTRYRLASSKSSNGLLQSRHERLFVTGRITADSDVRFETIRPTSRRSGMSPSGGSWRLEAVNEAGRVVAARSLRLASTLSGGKVFSAVLEPGAPVQSLRLRKDGELVARKDRSAHAPVIAFEKTRPADGGITRTVTWRSEDADGDTLRHDLFYRSDANAPWQLLAAGVTGQAVTVDEQWLSPGEAPMLKLSVSDGFNETVVRTQTVAGAGLRLLSYRPSEQLTRSRQPVVTAWFNAPIDRASLDADSFRLIGPDGKTIPATVTLDAGGRRAHLTPKQVLLPDQSYTARLNGDIRATTGERLDQTAAWPVRVGGPSRSVKPLEQWFTAPAEMPGQ